MVWDSIPHSSTQDLLGREEQGLRIRGGYRAKGPGSITVSALSLRTGSR